MNHPEPVPSWVCRVSSCPGIPIVCALAAILSLVLTGCGETSNDRPPVKLESWERGVAVTSPAGEDMTLYLWFYEWNLFDAMKPGENTRGTWKNEVRMSPEQKSGTIISDSPGLSLQVRASVDSADLTLSVTNQSDYDWPALAAIIPCFSPGPKAIRNQEFANQKTFFVGPEGLQSLIARESHYNHELRTTVDQMAHQ